MKNKNQKTDTESYNDGTIPCENCASPTPYKSTKRCNNCWEVESRLESYVNSMKGEEFVLQTLKRQGSSSNMYKMIEEVRKTNENNGWNLFYENKDWDDPYKLPTFLMLLVTEISEAMEAFRGGKIFQKIDPIPGIVKLPTGVSKSEIGYMRKMSEEEKKANFKEEMADVAIRLFDLIGGFYDTDFTLEIWDKINKNKKRGYKHGGKTV